MNSQKIEILINEIINSLGFNEAKIDLKKVCLRYDISIINQNLDDDISGMLLFKNNRNYIVVNSLQSSLRQRFTIAHELGHYFLHDRKSLYLDKKVFFRDNNSKNGNSRIEIEANNFAANLLMPKNRIENYITNYNMDFDPHTEKHIADMAGYFEVSQLAMTYRLINLYRL